MNWEGNMLVMVEFGLQSRVEDLVFMILWGEVESWSVGCLVEWHCLLEFVITPMEDAAVMVGGAPTVV